MHRRPRARLTRPFAGIVGPLGPVPCRTGGHARDTGVVTASRSTAGSGPPLGVAIEPLQLDEQTLDDVERVATDAFSDDPFFCFLMPSEKMRRRGLRIFFRSAVGTSGAVASVYGARNTDGTLVGVAAFVRPGGFPPPFAGQVRQLVGARSEPSSHGRPPWSTEPAICSPPRRRIRTNACGTCSCWPSTRPPRGGIGAASRRGVSERR